MDHFFQQLASLLTAPPGIIFFYLVLVLPVFSALFIHFSGRNSGKDPEPDRRFFGLLAILFAQILLVIVSILSWRGMVDSRLVLPPLERAVISISLTWIIWLWGNSKTNLKTDLLVVVFNILILGFYLFNLFSWNALAGFQSFNGGALDLAWLGIWVLFSSGGFILLLVRKPAGWEFGIIILALFLIGSIVQFLSYPIQGDYPAVVRVFELCAFLFLPGLTSLTIRKNSNGKSATRPGRFEQETIQPGLDPRTVNAWGDLLQKEDGVSLEKKIAKTIAITMGADFCFLITPSKDSETVDFTDGYDLLKEKEFPVFSLEGKQVPNLLDAMENGRVFRWQMDGHKYPDFAALIQVTGIGIPDHLLFFPVTRKGSEFRGIILLSPLSKKAWNSNDEKTLKTIFETLERLACPSPVSEEEEDGLLKAEQKTDQPGKITSEKFTSQIEGLISVQNDLQSIIENLQTENDQLRSTLSEKPYIQPDLENPANPRGLESELKLTLKEVAHLQNALADANLKILDMQENPIESMEDVGSLSSTSTLIKEIRKPMISVIGYCDLLLTESVGILGDLQRKFILRIRNFVEQINPLLIRLERYVQPAENQTGDLAAGMNVSEIIDDCLSVISNQLRQKDVTLRLQTKNLSSEKYSNPDKLREILSHLLLNACETTPDDGTIDLEAFHEYDEEGASRLSLQISDSGSGEDFEDIQKAFSLVSQAGTSFEEKPSWIDTVRRMVDSEGGRIWVESQSGKGTSFHILLPSLSGLSTRNPFKVTAR